MEWLFSSHMAVESRIKLHTSFLSPCSTHRGRCWNRSSGGSAKSLWWCSPTLRPGRGAPGRDAARSRPRWWSPTSVSSAMSSWMVRKTPDDHITLAINIHNWKKEELFSFCVRLGQFKTENSQDSFIFTVGSIYITGVHVALFRNMWHQLC